MYLHVFPPHWIKGFGIISSTLLYFVGLTETGTGFGGKGIWGKRFSKIWNRPPEDHSWQRGPNPHLPSPNFMKDPLYWLCLHPFLQILSNPLSLSMSLTTSTPTVPYVVLFLWLNGWLHHIWCAILLNVVMDIHIFGFRTLICVLCSKVSSLLRSDT